MARRSGRAPEADLVVPLVLDGAGAKAMEAATSGVVLAGLALHLGAGPLLIGLLAALPFFAQFAQFGGLRLVFATRTRRRLTLAGALASRLLLAGLGVLALAGPSPFALPALLTILFVSGCLNAVAAVSWSFWMRDLVPHHIYGELFSRRFAVQAVVSVATTLLAGVTLAVAVAAGAPGVGFAAVFFVGGAAGIAGLLFAARLPEVPLNPADTPPTPGDLVRGVGQRGGHREVVHFLAAWTSAAFLGVPFITVWLLRDVGLSFTVVSGFAAIAMVAGLATFRFWGRSVDRFGARAVLSLAIPGAALAMAVLPFAATPDEGARVLLAFVFVVSGAAFAAVDVAIGKVLMRSAPFTGAGTFLAGAGIVRAIAAGLATLAGGLVAHVVGARELRLAAAFGEWSTGGGLPAYALLFLASSLLMLYAWHRVAPLPRSEGGEARDVLHEAQVELTGLAPFRGVRIVGQFAAHVADHMLERRGGHAEASPARPPAAATAARTR